MTNCLFATRNISNVRPPRENRTLHRRRQSLRHLALARLRHRLPQAAVQAFQKRGYLLRAYYYTALVEDQEYSSIRPLIDWLDYNGYKVVTKPAKEFTDAAGRRKIKGNMDIELADRRAGTVPTSSTIW